MLKAIAKFIGKVFYTFLDISGILLGVFLTLTGIWLEYGRSLPGWMGVVLLLIGIGALITHVGHYFSWRITRWLFGPDYFIRK